MTQIDAAFVRPLALAVEVAGLTPR